MGDKIHSVIAAMVCHAKPAHLGAVCKRRQDASVASEQRRASLLVKHEKAVTKMVADPNFHAPQDIEVWTWKNAETDATETHWFIRWAQTAKSIKANAMEPMSAPQVRALSYWNTIRPVDERQKKGSAFKLPGSVTWPNEDGSGATVKLPVPDAAVGQSLNRVSSEPAIPRKSPVSAAAVSNGNALKDAIQASVGAVSMAVHESANKRANKEWKPLFDKARAKIMNPQEMSLAQYAAQLACASMLGEEGDALNAVGTPNSRIQGDAEWGSELSNPESMQRKINWIHIVRNSVESARLVAVAMDELAGASNKEARNSISQLRQEVLQSEEQERIVTTENKTLRDRVSSLEERLETAEDEIKDLRAKLAVANAKLVPHGVLGDVASPGKKEKKHKKEKEVEDSKGKKRLASQTDENESGKPPKEPKTPPRKPESHASAAIQDDEYHSDGDVV